MTRARFVFTYSFMLIFFYLILRFCDLSPKYMSLANFAAMTAISYNLFVRHVQNNLRDLETAERFVRDTLFSNSRISQSIGVGWLSIAAGWRYGSAVAVFGRKQIVQVELWRDWWLRNNDGLQWNGTLGLLLTAEEAASVERTQLKSGTVSQTNGA